jgi:hypothetical protein
MGPRPAAVERFCQYKGAGSWGHQRHVWHTHERAMVPAGKKVVVLEARTRGAGQTGRTTGEGGGRGSVAAFLVLYSMNATHV